MREVGVTRQIVSTVAGRAGARFGFAEAGCVTYFIERLELEEAG